MTLYMEEMVMMYYMGKQEMIFCTEKTETIS